MLSKLFLHYPHFLVFTIEITEQLLYQFSNSYSDLDRSSNIYLIVSIFTYSTYIEDDSNIIFARLTDNSIYI